MNKQDNTQNIEEIRYLFIVMARQFGLLQKESSQCCGVTMVQSHILYEIKMMSHLSLNDLAKRLGLDNSTTSRHVHGLVEKGYVQRQSDPNDRRYVTLGLTEQGAKLEEKISLITSNYITDLFSQLPEGKMDSISSELKLLTEAMCRSEFCCQPPL
ncbi:MarR family winged helix-turn-helix transcriptional regulator [Alkalihalobacillus sp. TS-13]|uniref:MarR family winged helix-turn-helix transcriptional regulator n=1 Tax=Alkalihalobacillus sp. TS-13 TaxID=2842455 RepID=UPI001C876F3A|nr:MarR family transcriptional regulator [Alkalihalobacillus sp. TS-13]